MGTRALNFSQAHKDPAEGYVAAVARLESSLTRAGQLAIQQRDGFSEVRAATAQKRELRRRMRRTQLLHLSRVAEAAGGERPELAQKFVLASEAAPYLAFRAAALGIANEAQNAKELLVKHGLSEPVLQSLTQSLEQFDRAVERGINGRRAHVGARAELDSIADEVVQVVRLIDGTNRFRFADQPESLAEWKSASNTVARRGSGAAGQEKGIGTSSGTPSQGGEIKPAA